MWPLVVGAGILAYLLFGKSEDKEMTPDAANEAMNKASQAASAGQAPTMVQTSAGPQPSAPATKPNAYKAPNLSAGNAIQNALNLLGYTDSAGNKLATDGHLNLPPFTYALSQFQARNGLTNSGGLPNPATLDAIANQIAQRGLNWQ